MRKLLVAFIISLYVAGCASVQKADESEDRKAKEFSLSSENESRIYVYRNQFAGSLITQGIFIDDIRVGTIDKCSYVYKDVQPGVHKISTTDRGFRDDFLIFKTDAGKIYFVEQEQAFGGITLNQRSAETAKPAIVSCSLARML